MSADDDQLVFDYLRQLREAASGLPDDRRDELVGEIAAHITEARAEGPVGGTDARMHVRNVLDRLGPPEAIVRAAENLADGLGPATFSPGSYGAADFSPAGYGPESYGASNAAPVAGYPVPRRPRPGAREITAVVLLLIGGFLAGIGWIVGVILLWTSSRWRPADKLLGTLVWPGGLLVPVLVLAALAGAGSLGTACGGHRTPAPQISMIGPNGQVSVSDGNVSVSGPDGDVSVSSVGHQVAGATSCASVGPGIPGWLAMTLAVALLVLTVCGPVLVAIRLLRRASREFATPTSDAATLQPV